MSKTAKQVGSCIRACTFGSLTSLGLLPGSLAIDKGSNEAYNRWGGPPIDFAGNSRIINRIVDLEAIEYR